MNSNWKDFVMETHKQSATKQINRETIWACIRKRSLEMAKKMFFPIEMLRFVFVRSLFFGDALCESNFNDANLNFASVSLLSHTIKSAAASGSRILKLRHIKDSQDISITGVFLSLCPLF